MANYTVRWEINVEADDPVKAAVEALEIQQDPFSEAVVYDVTEDATNIKTVVDLLTEEY